MPALATNAPAAADQNTSLARLRRAARILFVRDGFHHTRPQDIVREAGVAHGTFYLHFRDKREAFLDFAGQAQDDLLAAYRTRLDGVTCARERWEIIFGTVIDFSGQHPGVLYAAFFDPVFIAGEDPESLRLYDRLGRLVRLVVDDEAAAARLEEKYDLEMISHALCGMLRHALLYGARKQIPRERLVRDLAGFIGRALELPS